jgi:hypothetical protein
VGERAEPSTGVLDEDGAELLRWWARTGLIAGAAGGGMVAVCGWRLGGLNLAAGSLLAVALLKVLELTAKGLSQSRKRHWAFSVAVTVPKYCLIVAGLYLLVRTGYFQPLWFVGGFALVHGLLLVRALRTARAGV